VKLRDRFGGPAIVNETGKIWTAFMQKIDRRGLVLTLAGLSTVLTGCSPLSALNTLNTLTPGDGGVHRVAQGVAYGPDPRQRLDVYAPAKMSGPAPVVVFYYGGGWDSGDRHGYAFVGEALAARGFVVVVPDYRLVPDVVFPAFVQDSAAAVRWTVDHIATYGGDPKRLGVSGHSAGAYNAMMVALDPQWLRQAGVDPDVVRAVACLAGPFDFLPFDVKASQRAFGSYRDPQATQPISFVHPGAPPAFLAYGTKDTTVRPKNSLNLAAALEAKGDVVELKAYPGLDHVAILLALSKPFRGKAPVLDDMTRFLHAHLG
jgi:acetyl esterase/lipase